MKADDLLDYARDVAEDLDVRRQTLNEGLQGIDTIQQSFDENKKVYDTQQQELQSQLQSLRGELDSFERQQAEQKKREAQRVDVDDEELRQTIGAQRDQLELLGTRIRQLMATNQELTLANKKTRGGQESTVDWVGRSLAANSMDFVNQDWFSSANSLRNLIAHNGARGVPRL